MGVDKYDPPFSAVDSSEQNPSSTVLNGDENYVSPAVVNSKGHLYSPAAIDAAEHDHSSAAKDVDKDHSPSTIAHAGENRDLSASIDANGHYPSPTVMNGNQNHPSSAVTCTGENISLSMLASADEDYGLLETKGLDGHHLPSAAMDGDEVCPPPSASNGDESDCQSMDKNADEDHPSSTVANADEDHENCPPSAATDGGEYRISPIAIDAAEDDSSSAVMETEENHQAREATKIENYFLRRLLKDVTRKDCDARAEELVGAPVCPVDVQGLCSYTVFAGKNRDKVVNFREETLSKVNVDQIKRAWEIHGDIVPKCELMGSIGILQILVMPRITGDALSDIVFKKEDKMPADYRVQLTNTTTDLAEFLGDSWNSATTADQDPARAAEFKTFVEKEIIHFIDTLPRRHQQFLRKIQNVMEKALDNAHPFVLTHLDLLPWNILVNHLGYITGIIDWWDAQEMPFGIAIQGFFFSCLGYMDENKEWHYHIGYQKYEDLFWRTFEKRLKKEMRVRDRAGMEVSQMIGYYLRYGSTWDETLGDQGAYRPSRDGDEKMAYLDALLEWTTMQPATSYWSDSWVDQRMQSTIDNGRHNNVLSFWEWAPPNEQTKYLLRPRLTIPEKDGSPIPPRRSSVRVKFAEKATVYRYRG